MTRSRGHRKASPDRPGRPTMETMAETHVPEVPKKIHGDKLAEAFRQQQPDVTRMPRHPAGPKEKTQAVTPEK